MTTYKSDRSHVINHIQPVLGLGEKRIATVTTDTYEKWLRKVARNLARGDEDPERQRKAKYTANQCLKILKAALNRAYRTNRSLPKAVTRTLPVLNDFAPIFLTSLPGRFAEKERGARSIVLAEAWVALNEYIGVASHSV